MALCRNGGMKMSKVICDVCGTTYPETAAQCPICGSAKKSTSQTAAGSNGDQSYAYVKGGRFSKTNVRKRNKKGQEFERRSSGDRTPKNDNANAVLIAIVILLVIAIVAVLGYMGIRVFLSGPANDPQDNTPAVSEPTGSSTPTDLSCTNITLTRSEIEFTSTGQAQLLSYSVLPTNTEDKVEFSSSDPAVATVSDRGLVTAVGGGQTTITVTCGQQKAECQIICSFGSYTEPTDPSDPTDPTVIVPPGYELTLKYKEFTMSKTYPSPVGIYVSNSSVKATDITWTSDDPNIATVNEKGVVTAVGRGNTTIRATFGDQTASCKVIVAFDPEPVKEAKYKISHTDVTLKVGESFSIFLTDSEGVNVKVEWTASVEGYVEIKDRNIKGIKSTADVAGRCITISATIEDETYKCTIRVV